MWFKSNFTIPAVAVISFCLIGGATPASADLGDQLFKLLPDDGAAGNYFGLSVAISGDTTIVGAPQDDDNGLVSGSAYLFDISDPANPKQVFKLLPNDGAAVDIFGFSVGISGDTAIVGAFQKGSAYLFDTTTGKQTFKLLPNDGAAGFGNSVAISGDTAIVGARSHDSAYLFDTTTGRQIFKLLPKDGEPNDQFGNSVAISGDTAVVGAPDAFPETNPGSAYLFDIADPANPVQIAKLLADDGETGDRSNVPFRRRQRGIEGGEEGT